MSVKIHAWDLKVGDIFVTEYGSREFEVVDTYGRIVVLLDVKSRNLREARVWELGKVIVKEK